MEIAELIVSGLMSISKLGIAAILGVGVVKGSIGILAE